MTAKHLPKIICPSCGKVVLTTNRSPIGIANHKVGGRASGYCVKDGYWRRGAWR